MKYARYKGLNIIQALIFLFILPSSLSIYAQAVVKISCLMPYEIKFSENNVQKVENSVIKYEQHDDHTFWYKLFFELLSFVTNKS